MRSVKWLILTAALVVAAIGVIILLNTQKVLTIRGTYMTNGSMNNRFEIRFLEQDKDNTFKALLKRQANREVWTMIEGTFKRGESFGFSETGEIFSWTTELNERFFPADIYGDSISGRWFRHATKPGKNTYTGKIETEGPPLSGFEKAALKLYAVEAPVREDREETGKEMMRVVEAARQEKRRADVAEYQDKLGELGCGVVLAFYPFYEKYLVTQYADLVVQEMNYRLGRYLQGTLSDENFARLNEKMSKEKAGSPVYYHWSRVLHSRYLQQLLQRPENAILPRTGKQALYQKESEKFYQKFYDIQLHPSDEMAFLEDFAAAIYQWGNRTPTVKEKELLTTRAAALKQQQPGKAPDIDRIFQQIQRFDLAGKVNVGMMAPEFAVKTIDGQDMKLLDYRGKYVFIDFWGSWCGPCLQQIPNIKKLSRMIPGDSLQVIGLARDDPDALKAFIRKEKLLYPNAIADQQLLMNYAILAFPTTFLLAPDGKIIAKNLRGPNLTGMVRAKIKADGQ